MRGYIFDSEQDAVTAISCVNACFGIPVSTDAVTQTYTNYIKWGDAWAIMADESLVVVLGDSAELPELPEPNELNIDGNGLES